MIKKGKEFWKKEIPYYKFIYEEGKECFLKKGIHGCYLNLYMIFQIVEL